MSTFHRVTSQGRLKPGYGRTFEVTGIPVALFNVEGCYYAIHDTCPHAQGPLGSGLLEGAVVSCPFHGWKFDVTTGTCQVRESASVPAFRVKVEGEDVLVCVDPPE